MNTASSTEPRVVNGGFPVVRDMAEINSTVRHTKRRRGRNANSVEDRLFQESRVKGTTTRAYVQTQK